MAQPAPVAVTRRLQPMEERILVSRIYRILESDNREDGWYSLLEIVHMLDLDDYLHPIRGNCAQDSYRLIQKEITAGGITADKIEGRPAVTFFRSNKKKAS